MTANIPRSAALGTEDYIGSGYGQGLYNNLYQGNHFIGKNACAFGFYRFHIPDPVYFYENARVHDPGYGRTVVRTDDRKH